MTLKGLFIVQTTFDDLEETTHCTKLIVDLQWILHCTNSIWWPWRDSSLYRQHLLILKGLFIVQTSFDDLEGTLHCTNSICWSWRDSFIVQTTFDDLEGTQSLHCTNSICWSWRDSVSSLYKQHLMILKGLFIVQTAFVDLEGTLHCTDIIWWPRRDYSLYKTHCWFSMDSSLYKQHLLTLKGLFIVQTAFDDLEGTHHSTNSIWWFLRNSSLYKTHCWSSMDSSLYKQHLLILKGLFIVQTAFDDLEGTHHCTNNICWSWRDSSLYKQHLLTLKELFILQTSFL